MPDQARVVVIGGGITGCSVAYHLAEAGWKDIILVEKAGLTAGSTSQAAGLVTAFNPSSAMLAWRRYSIELYGRLGVFDAVGSVRLASSPAQLKELERAASRARGVGLDVGVISPAASVNSRSTRSSCTGGPGLRLRPRLRVWTDHSRCKVQSRFTRFRPAASPRTARICIYAGPT